MFYKACDGGFKVSDFLLPSMSCTYVMQEQSEGIIDMGHVPYKQLERLVSFFYKMDYNEALAEGERGTPLQIHAQMFALADEYEIADMLLKAQLKYLARCERDWDPPELLSSIPDVFGSTPDSLKELRQIACVAVRKYLPGMLKNTASAGCFERTLSENPTFAKDLLQSYIENPLFGYCQSCCSNHGMDPLQTRCKSCNKGQGGFCSRLVL